MGKKQQTTEHEDSHGHIISHHAPAALLPAEKNTIKLGSNVCVCIYIYTVGTESIQTPLNFSLFVILQPFAKII